MCESYATIPGAISVYRDTWMGHVGIMDDYGNLVDFSWSGLAVHVQ